MRENAWFRFNFFFLCLKDKDRLSETFPMADDISSFFVCVAANFYSAVFSLCHQYTHAQNFDEENYLEPDIFIPYILAE